MLNFAFMEQKQPNYRWPGDAKFEISGMQLEYAMNALHKILSTPEAQQILALTQLMAVMEQALHRGIAEGIVVDTNQPDPTPAPTKEVDLAVEG